MKPSNKFGLDQTLALIKSGDNPSKISKDLGIPKQTINYYVGKLKKLGCIEKKGYGTWDYLQEVPKVPKGSQRGKSSDLSKKQIRGHAFIWKIEFYDPYDWKNIIKNYKKKKLTFQTISNGKVYRTIFNSRKIWLTKRGMVIYEPLDFIGKSSFQVKGTAVFEMDKLIKGLLSDLNVKLKPYRFTTSREHYAIIKNELAKQYNDTKKKMFIRNESGTVWMWIDFSHGVNELENNEVVVNRQLQKFWNSNKDHNFKVDADFILKGFQETTKQIKENAKNLDQYAVHLKAHVKSVQDLGNGVKEQTLIFGEIRDLLKELKR